jgi:hypothetical protein
MRIFVFLCTHFEYNSKIFTRVEIFLNTFLAANVVQTLCCDSFNYTLYLYAFYPLNCN